MRLLFEFMKKFLRIVVNFFFEITLWFIFKIMFEIFLFLKKRVSHMWFGLAAVHW
jgi:hypothetical protein